MSAEQAPVDAQRAALERGRAEALERIAAAERDFTRIVEASQSVSTDDEHDPDGAGLAVERAQIVAFLDQARTHVAAVDAALDRLATGDYGRCTTCGDPIAPERLTARPEATQCIRCAAVTSRRR
jgi:RNA polymerase-binding transcription factor DksA